MAQPLVIGQDHNSQRCFLPMRRYPFYLQGQLWSSLEDWYQLVPVPSKSRKLLQPHKLADWDKVLWEGLIAEFSQHPELARQLLDTAPLNIITTRITTWVMALMAGVVTAWEQRCCKYVPNYKLG